MADETNQTPPSNTPVGFFEETTNVKSSMRLIFIVGYFWLMLVTSFIIYLKTFKGLVVSWVEITGFFTMASGVLSGTKLFQNSQTKP